MDKHDKIKSITLIISRYILAALFIFSGFAKSINPFGMSIQIEEYLNAMNLGFLAPLSLCGAVILPSLETLLGLMLLFNLCKKVSSWAAMLFMSFFTLLTLWIAIFNPVSDCGCFGDLVKLSNWGTFVKNLVILPMSILLFLDRNNTATHLNYEPTKQTQTSYRYRKTPKPITIKYIAIVIISFILPLYTVRTLPIIDATPYKIGVNIPQAMDNGTDQDMEYHTIVIYKNIKTGDIQEFEVDDTTWHDTRKWEYVDSRTSVKENNSANNDNKNKISSLPMLRDGKDVAMDILHNTKPQLLFIIPMWDKLSFDLQNKMLELINNASHKNIKSIILTADNINNTPDLLSKFIATNPSSLQILGGDHTVLKTMIQNKYGGAMLLENGTIINKWSAHKLPHTI